MRHVVAGGSRRRGAGLTTIVAFACLVLCSPALRAGEAVVTAPFRDAGVKVAVTAPPRPPLEFRDSASKTEPSAPTPAPLAPQPVSPLYARPPTLPAVAVEVDGGAQRLWRAADAGLRVGLRGVFAPELFGRVLGGGLGLASGPALATPYGIAVSDSSIQVFACARVPLRGSWLEFDAGPTIHFLSAGEGPSASRRTDVALDALAGVVVPWNRLLFGARVGGFYDFTSPHATALTEAAPIMVVWVGEAMLTVGFAVQ